MMASKYGHPAIVRALVKARADPSICDKVSHSPDPPGVGFGMVKVQMSDNV
jgi:hypothetical protein